MRDSVNSLITGLMLTLLAIYALLAIPFKSYAQPLIVLLCIPFGMVGAVIGHVIMGYSLSLMSMFGLVALSGVGSSTTQEVFPEIEMDTVSVTVSYPGASPEEIERAIVQAVEESIEGIEGIEDITSVANENSATIRAELLDGADVDRVWQDIKTEVDRITTFPDEAEDPRITIDSRKRSVLTLVVSGNVSELVGKRSSYDDVQQYSLGAAAAYELDLWGRIEAQRSASEQQLYATQADLDAAAVTVAASVAETWVDLLRVREEIAILNEQVANNKKQLVFQEFRFTNGIAESVDVLQQRQILASSQSELPLLIAREQVLLNALSVLIGSTPLERPTVIQKELPELIALPPTGLPSDLLINRPDIRSSGLQLFSAEWSVAEARANRLPQFTLNADAAFNSSVAAICYCSCSCSSLSF